MSKLKYLIIPALIGGLSALPVVISNGIDERLEANRVVFERNGLKQVMLSKSGYIDNVRTFSLEVTDTAKARDFLLNKLVEKRGQYKLLADSVKSQDNGSARGLDGLSFKGEMLNSNLAPTDIKITLTLDKLPKALHEEVTQDKEVANVLLPLIAKGVFALDMQFGSSEKMKDIQLKGVKLKDIKEQIKIEDVTLDINTQNHAVALKESGDVLNGTVDIVKQDISLLAEMFLLKSHLENLKYNFSYKDDFNNKSDMELGKYSFEMAEPYENMKLGLGSVKATSSLEEVQKNLQIKADYTLSAIDFMSQTDDIKVDQLLLKLDIKGIESALMKKLQEDYKKVVLGTEVVSDQVLIDDFVGLINHGAKMDIGVVLKGVRGEVSLKDVTIDTTLEIAKNNYTDKQSPLALINLIDITSKAKIHKDDKKTLEALSFSAPEDFAQGKAEGDFFIYDLVMKNGQVKLNGKVIQ